MNINTRYDLSRAHTENDPNNQPSNEVDPKLAETFGLVGVGVPSKAPAVASAQPAPRTIASMLPTNTDGKIQALVEGRPLGAPAADTVDSTDDDDGDDDDDDGPSATASVAPPVPTLPARGAGARATYTSRDLLAYVRQLTGKASIAEQLGALHDLGVAARGAP